MVYFTKLKTQFATQGCWYRVELYCCLFYDHDHSVAKVSNLDATLHTTICPQSATLVNSCCASEFQACV